MMRQLSLLAFLLLCLSSPMAYADAPSPSDPSGLLTNVKPIENQSKTHVAPTPMPPTPAVNAPTPSTPNQNTTPNPVTANTTTPPASTPSTPTPPAITPPVIPPPVAMPSDITLSPDQSVYRYLAEKGYFIDIDSGSPFHPEAPLSRAEFVTMLYRATHWITPFTSEFAYFRDVPVNYWAYLPIEGFRMHRTIWSGSADFRPNLPISRLNAAVMLSRTFNDDWLKLTDQDQEALLKAYPEARQVNAPAWAKRDLAKALYAGFLLPVYQAQPGQSEGDYVLALTTPLTRMDAIRMVYRRALYEDQDRVAETQHIPVLPANIQLVISPTTTISATSLNVNATIYFALVEALAVSALSIDLPKGTRFGGSVTQISADKHLVQVTLDRANTPAGDLYNLKAEITLTFDTGSAQKAYISPGQNYTVSTESP